MGCHMGHRDVDDMNQRCNMVREVEGRWGGGSMEGGPEPMLRQSS